MPVPQIGPQHDRDSGHVPKMVPETKTLQNSTHSECEAPDGGLGAWLVVAGGFSIFFSCLGFTSAFGILQEYYMTHQLKDKSADQIAWIGSIAGFIQFSGGAVGGPLFDRYGAWMLRPATLVYVFGMMMTSLCSEYWQFMLTQGVLMGLAMAFLQFPAFAAVSQYFDKRRAAALGIVVSGSSVGGIVIPIALSKMLNSSSIEFGWSLRIIGFTILPFMTFACVTIKPRLTSRPTTFFISNAFKDKKYVLLVASMFFMMMGMWTPLFFLPTYAVSRGMSATLASYLLAVINAASTLGRVIPGIMADKYGRLNIFCFAGFSTGIIVLLLDQATSSTGLVIYAISVGFFSGTIISGASVAISMCAHDPRDLGTYMGMGMGVSSIATLIGPPVNGALVDRYGGFLEVSIFSGTLCLVGGFIALCCKSLTSQGLLGRV